MQLLQTLMVSVLSSLLTAWMVRTGLELPVEDGLTEEN